MFAKRTVIFLCCCILWVCFSSCSLRAIKEAEAVVAQADSLWRNGRRYTDSLSLAQAYNTLHQLPIINHHSTSYAHACYHYGRLLRDHDDPVSAMQVFINASHSRTHDYHILGRVYSNMGSICHLANEFPLSYDMYQRSANMFLRNGDTLLYYFGQYNMAYELAEQGKKDSCFALTENIRSHDPKDSTLIAYCYMSQAQACFRCQQYDSMLFYARQSKCNISSLPACTMQLAQAYSLLGVKDSAAYYAEQVLVTSNALSDINNALYILTNDDQTKDIEDVRLAAADRSDTQKQLAERQGKLSQAVQLLEQDLARLPDDLRILIIVSILLVFFTVLFIVFRVIHHKRQQIQQDLHLQQEHHQLLLQQQSDYLQKRVSDLEISCAALRNSSNIKAELDWNNYDSMCAIANSRLYGIVDRLHAYPKITDNDVRFCILVLLEFSYDDIANILNISPKSIAKLKSISAQRLGTTMKDLRKKLIQIVCQNNEI